MRIGEALTNASTDNTVTVRLDNFAGSQYNTATWAETGPPAAQRFRSWIDHITSNSQIIYSLRSDEPDQLAQEGTQDEG